MISWRKPSACGGVLDVDRNAGNPVETPIENIAFTRAPAAGAYRATVTNFSQRGAQSNPFQLRIQRGDNAETREGTLMSVDTSLSFDFTYP